MSQPVVGLIASHSLASFPVSFEILEVSKGQEVLGQRRKIRRVADLTRLVRSSLTGHKIHLSTTCRGCFLYVFVDREYNYVNIYTYIHITHTYICIYKYVYTVSVSSYAPPEKTRL